MNESEAYKIRPAGRLILTIGRDLIQDVHAAVVELVKNAYDADSPDVSIEFAIAPEGEGICIVIADHGHGMTRDDVINKWLVPSTPDKLKRKKSPSGRIMQGRKGVGRYAASVLGSSLLMETVTMQGEKTEVYIEWQEFENSAYLDDVEVLVGTSITNEPSGTRLTIQGKSEFLVEWSPEQINKLRFELRKLKSPVEVAMSNDEFQIHLEVHGLSDIEDISETIEPFPIFGLFDYRINGTISSSGKGELFYSMQKIRNNALDATIPFDYGRSSDCGELQFDIRVYDRDSQSITSLIRRGLQDVSGQYVGNLQARRLLNEYNGIGVYRNGFRLRPLGDPDFDWLRLNQRRVQNPSLRIGSNQVIGFVQIQSDEESGLIEKSARDGLRDNKAFENLKDLTTLAIAELESRRFDYRRRAGLSRAGVRIEHALGRLFSSLNLQRDVQSKLALAGVEREDAEDILDIISRDDQERNRIADEIRQEVAIYQGQTTVGKIVDIILHEGRRPLLYFRNEIPSLRYWYDSYMKTQDNDALHEVVLIGEGIGLNAEQFVDLFGKLDPLASKKREEKAKFHLYDVIGHTFSIFRTRLNQNEVTTNILCPNELSLTGWSQDFYWIFTNLIENSLYWMEQQTPHQQEISVYVHTQDKELLFIDFRDNGPGIDQGLIASEVIFEPNFSTKPDGTGLGLPIAGEAAARNGLELKALYSDTGAWFRLEPVMEDTE